MLPLIEELRRRFESWRSDPFEWRQDYAFGKLRAVGERLGITADRSLGQPASRGGLYGDKDTRLHGAVLNGLPGGERVSFAERNCFRGEEHPEP
jgi:hypothetical protein